jgi:hypothetical protein
VRLEADIEHVDAGGRLLEAPHEQAAARERAAEQARD